MLLFSLLTFFLSVNAFGRKKQGSRQETLPYSKDSGHVLLQEKLNLENSKKLLDWLYMNPRHEEQLQMQNPSLMLAIHEMRHSAKYVSLHQNLAAKRQSKEFQTSLQRLAEHQTLYGNNLDRKEIQDYKDHLYRVSKLYNTIQDALMHDVTLNRIKNPFYNSDSKASQKQFKESRDVQNTDLFPLPGPSRNPFYNS